MNVRKANSAMTHRMTRPRRLLLPGAALLALALLALLTAAAIQPAPTVTLTPTDGTFPAVSGDNLNGDSFDLPGDLAGEYNLMLIAFEREQQPLIETWGRFIQQLQADHQTVRVYEVPVIPPMNPLTRSLIDGGMRFGIGDEAIRQTTITIYTDVDTFTASLDITDTTTIHALLIDRDGAVYWRDSGAFTPEMGAALTAVVAGLAA